MSWDFTLIDILFLLVIYGAGAVLGYFRYCGLEYVLSALAFAAGILFHLSHSAAAFFILLQYGYLVFWKLWLIVVVITPMLLVVYVFTLLQSLGPPFQLGWYQNTPLNDPFLIAVFASLIAGILLAHYSNKDVGSEGILRRIDPEDAPLFEGVHFTTTGLLAGITVYYIGYGAVWSLLSCAGFALVSIAIHRAGSFSSSPRSLPSSSDGMANRTLQGARPASVRCPSCGTVNSVHVVFCSTCGQRLPSVEAWSGGDQPS